VAIARAVWFAAAGGVPNCWKSGSYPAETAGSSSNSADGKAGGGSSHATPAAAAAGKGGGAAAAAAGESTESKLLEKAAQLLQGVIRTSHTALGLPAVAGCTWDHDGGEAAAAAAAGSGTGGKGTSSSGSKGSLGKGGGGKQAKGHGAKVGKADKHGHGAAAEGADQLLQAQQQQLLVEGLMQLAEVIASEDRINCAEMLAHCLDAAVCHCAAGCHSHKQLTSAVITALDVLVSAECHALRLLLLLLLHTQVELLRWMPGQALQLSLAATAAIVSASGSSSSNTPTPTSSSSSGTAAMGRASSRNDDMERVALHPGVWLAARCQVCESWLGHVLLLQSCCWSFHLTVLICLHGMHTTGSACAFGSIHRFTAYHGISMLPASTPS
jgi:hypothetical protein